MVNGSVSTNAGKLCVKAPDASDDEYILYVRIFDYKEQIDIASLDFSANPVKLDEKIVCHHLIFSIRQTANMRTELLRFYRKNRQRKLIPTDGQLWRRFLLKTLMVINKPLMS
ncbi:hypothetical protein UA45_02185 [Morganella morganii]|uniref:Uncharacterized protein n=1 Tax=Morganella morganii TaxID=582 RepID=A0A0D8LE03_MORMO|nr:hypothetical protein UA45_02185 [Morganella morganii]